MPQILSRNSSVILSFNQYKLISIRISLSLQILFIFQDIIKIRMRKSEQIAPSKIQSAPPLPKDRNKSAIITVPQETKPFNVLDYAKDGVSKD